MHSSVAPRLSDIPAIQNLLSEKIEQLSQAGITVELKKILPYGSQLLLRGSGQEGLLNVYHSAKKGFSFVDCSRNAPTQMAQAILLGSRAAAPVQAHAPSLAEEKLQVWIGTDESGKGDFFGPLVIAGFVMSREMTAELMVLGVADSKKLTAPKIAEIAATLHRKYPDHIAVVAPSVAKYNELYEKFANLNRLLAWGHARVIENLLASWPKDKGVEIDGAVADQFGDERYIKTALQSMKSINLIQRPKGESNIGVAAASIIARDCFEKKVAQLGRQFGMKFPLGASARVITAAHQFVKQYGKARMHEVAKIHFKTYREIAG